MYYPFVILDSGHQVTNGRYEGSDFKTVYRSLIQAELARPPRAEVDAWWRRIGDTIRVYATFTNRCGATLSTAANDATVHAMIWEEAKAGVTSRYVRAAPYQALTTALDDGASASFALDTATLTGVDWTKLHTVVMVDYRPAGAFTGAYDMLQAAIAQPAAIAATPANLLFNVSISAPGTPQSAVSLRGPYVVSWTASADVPWLSVAPANGSLPAQPVISVVTAQLVAGPQNGMITVTGTSADGMSLTTTIPVTVSFTNELPGDVDGNGAIGVSDVFYLANFIFGAGPAPLGLHDPNGDGQTNAADVFYLVNYLFAGGPAPKG